jgi:ATP-dependent helicase HrpB
LTQLFPQSIRKERTAIFDEARGRVVGVSRLWYRDLLLAEETGTAVDSAEASRVLAEALRPGAEKLLLEDAAANALLRRIALLRKHMPEHPWPVVDSPWASDVVCEAASGRRALGEVRAALAGVIESRLVYPLDRLLEQHAPRTIEVPTGNKIAIDYSGERPVLAVRLQEIFGWVQTPRIAGGRVPLVVHLLGPNYRPVQITDDLANFWATTYFQVRKDLRARYPKHSWPDDPLVATPQAKGNRRRG